MKLFELLLPHPALSRGLLGEWGNDEIEDVVTDAASATPHSLYVVTKTPLRDGQNGMAAAYQAGCRVFLARHSAALPADALTLIAEEPEAFLGDLAAACYGYPSREMTVLGVTGSHGKTATVDMAAALLRRHGVTVATLTTDGVSVGRRFEAADSRAKDAADIQRLLRRFAEKGTEFALIEFSSYMLKHEAHRGISFTAVLLTDYESLHQGPHEHRNEEEYRKAKQRLLSAGAPLVWLPYGCSCFSPTGKVLRFGKEGNVAASHVTPFPNPLNGSAFSLTFEGERRDTSTPVMGDFAIHNALAAASLALTAGVPLSAVAEYLPIVKPRGTLYLAATHYGRRVYFDTAYTGKDVERAISTLRAATAGKLTVLLGSVGGRAVARRAPLGYAAVKCADHAYFTADDPDFENVRHIIGNMLELVENAPNYTVIPQREAAIAAAVADLRPGDVLLIFGKSKDETQLIDGKKEPFSDLLAVKKAMRYL